jgi:osmotically inducible protein OsmC
MAVRTADARWQGSLQEGDGRMVTGSGAFDGEYSFKTRFGEEEGTNPEELIGAAHAGCFSMALSGALGREGYRPEWIETRARVHLGKKPEGIAITKIELAATGKVPEISNRDFRRIAGEAKKNCPVSRALAGVEIDLDAELLK